MYTGTAILRKPEKQTGYLVSVRNWQYQDTSQMSDKQLRRYYKRMPNKELMKDLLPRLGPLGMWFKLTQAVIQKLIRDHVWQMQVNILRINFRRENVVECIVSFLKKP